MSHRIVYLERDSIRAVLRAPTFPHVWEEYPLTAADQVFERIAEASIVIVNKVPMRAELLARLPTPAIIACAATGTDNVDLAWCREHGLPVSNIRGYAVNTVPEHVMMLMLALRRQLLAYRADVQAGRWQQAPMFCFFDHPLRDLHGSTLGLIGRGSLGTGRGAAGRGLRHEGAVGRTQGGSDGARRLRSLRDAAGRGRRDLAALSADRRDARHDR